MTCDKGQEIDIVGLQKYLSWTIFFFFFFIMRYCSAIDHSIHCLPSVLSSHEVEPRKVKLHGQIKMMIIYQLIIIITILSYYEVKYLRIWKGRSIASIASGAWFALKTYFEIF